MSAALATDTALLCSLFSFVAGIVTSKRKVAGFIRHDYGGICCGVFTSLPECLSNFLDVKGKKVSSSVRNSYILNQSKPIQ